MNSTYPPEGNLKFWLTCVEYGGPTYSWPFGPLRRETEAY